MGHWFSRSGEDYIGTASTALQGLVSQRTGLDSDVPRYQILRGWSYTDSLLRPHM